MDRILASVSSRVWPSALVLLVFAPLLSAADGVPALRKWFDRYRRGHVDLQQSVESGYRAPSADGGGVRYYRTSALEELESLLAGAVEDGGEPAARLLLEAAVYRAHPDPTIERRRAADRQPWLLRRLARDALARLAGADVTAFLRETALRDRSPLEGEDRRIVAALTLGRLGDQAAAPRIADLLRQDGPPVRAAAARALGILGDPAAAAALVATQDDPVADVRLEGLLSLALLARQSADEALVRAVRATAIDRLDDPAWFVRQAAARLLEEHPDVASVPPLVEALIREQSGQEGARRRVRVAVRAALGRITGEDFPSFRPDDWARWWEENEDSFVAVTPELEAVVPEQGARFFGIPVEADEVVFLLDVSGSMDQPVEGDPDGPSRLFFALREMRRVLEALEDGTRFNIVLFAETMVPFRAVPVPKTPDTVAAALAFLEGIEAGGGTDLHGALEFVLGLGDSALADRVLGGGVDTVVLLTDGRPSRGTVLVPDEILHQLTEANRRRRIAIHTVSAGGQPNSFLRELAERNHGEFRVLAGS